MGATRHMLPVVFMKDGRVTKFSLDNSSTAEKSRRVSIDTSDPSSVLTLEDLVDGAVCVKKVNAKRIKLILCDYIFIRYRPA